MWAYTGLEMLITAWAAASCLISSRLEAKDCPSFGSRRHKCCLSQKKADEKLWEV